MYVINIKPLSVNEIFSTTRKGLRVKSKAYKQYTKDIKLISPNHVYIPDGLIEAHYNFYLSNRGADIDNFIKAIQDLLSSKYNFNDNKIYKIIVEKFIVKKGCEKIEFEYIKYGE